jgi:hypothetical protein
VSAPLQIALIFFSGVRLQSWLNWGAGPLLGIALLWALATDSPRTAITAIAFAMFGVVLLVLVPVYAGGALLRMASTPTIMHLRPHGRRQMLLGATLAITLIAVLITLPAVVYPLSPLRITGKHAFNNLPPAAVFQFAWGSAALLWVGVFALSSRPALLPFCFIGLALVSRMAAPLISGLPFEREQLMVMLFATGIVAWIAFALWYLAGPSVLRRGMIGSWVSGTGQQDFSRFNPRSLFRRNPASDAPISRAIATSQYLTGADSNWNAVLMGAIITSLITVLLHLLIKQPDQRSLTFILTILAISSVTMTVMGVRRSRLLWLRAGLDRAALFAVTERHALRATLSLFAVPVAVFVTMGVTQQPALAAPLLLHTATQMALGACAMYAGTTVTRGVNAGTFVMFIALGIVGIVAMSILQPHKVISPLAHIVAFSLFSGLALVLRSYAKSAWLKLDWRMAGPALHSFGRHG